MAVVTVSIVGVGGQGALTVSKILGAAAVAAGTPVFMSEIHGMAQRGGVVTTTLRFGPARSPLPFSNDITVVLGFEPLETYRARKKIMPETIVVMNLDPIRPTSVSSGGAEYPSIEDIKEEVGSHARKLYTISAMEKADEVGNDRVTNVVMLGALIGSGVMPFTPDQIKKAIKETVPENAIEDNMKAFELGYSEIHGSP